MTNGKPVDRLNEEENANHKQTKGNAMAATLKQDACKAEEIQHFAEFVAALPRGSYLKSILSELPDMVEGMIRNDFGYSIAGDLRRLNQEKLQAEAECRTLAGKLADIEKQVAEKQKLYRTLDAAIRDLKEKAQETLQTVLRS